MACCKLDVLSSSQNPTVDGPRVSCRRGTVPPEQGAPFLAQELEKLKAALPPPPMRTGSCSHRWALALTFLVKDIRAATSRLPSTPQSHTKCLLWRHEESWERCVPQSQATSPFSNF